MFKGYDTSFQPPTATCMYADGFRWVLGYVGPGSDKFITPALRDEYHAAGLNIGFLVEGSEGDVLQGYHMGVTHANLALSQATALGAPVQDCVFTFAADIDITPSNIDQAIPYFQGANSVVGVARTGVYGDTDIIARLHDQHLASFFFLTAARSWDTAPVETYIDIFQVQNGINGCNGNYDLNTATTMPRGLWAPGGTVTQPQQSYDEIHNLSLAMFWGGSSCGTLVPTAADSPWKGQPSNALLAKLDYIIAALKAGAAVPTNISFTGTGNLHA